MINKALENLKIHIIFLNFEKIDEDKSEEPDNS